ncbi:MAG: hypothetical protein F6K26_34425, partial [Moorea sp. SIO2I5]|nr:hypothetical protein [Moorena sp. SIO2I5]
MVNKLPQQFIKELIEFLTTIEILEDEQNRSSLLDGIPSNVSQNIKREKSTNSDIRSIIRTANDCGEVYTDDGQTKHSVKIILENLYEKFKNTQKGNQINSYLKKIDQFCDVPSQPESPPQNDRSNSNNERSSYDQEIDRRLCDVPSQPESSPQNDGFYPNQQFEERNHPNSKIRVWLETAYYKIYYIYQNYELQIDFIAITLSVVISLILISPYISWLTLETEAFVSNVRISDADQCKKPLEERLKQQAKNIKKACKKIT